MEEEEEEVDEEVEEEEAVKVAPEMSDASISRRLCRQKETKVEKKER